jgi:hypothetical protein
MECGIIAVVEIGSAIHRGAAKEKNIIALDEKVGILETDLLCIRLVAEVDKVFGKLPMFTIL